MLRIPSLSADPHYAGEIRRMAEWLAATCAAWVSKTLRVMETAGHPVAYAEWLGAGKDKPTVLVYGHYDVVPAAMEDGWDTPPFEPVEKDGKVYARGATDDKGQFLIHIKALESYLKTHGAAPVNVKILLEGEEEISSPNLTPFIKANLDLLKADVCVISDSSMRIIEEPAITHSLRGHVLHRGRGRRAARGLAQRFLGWRDPQPRPGAGGDHPEALQPGPHHRGARLLRRCRPADARRAGHAGEGRADRRAVQRRPPAYPPCGATPSYSIRERVSARPTLDINGIWSGWSGPGPKTIIPARAAAKLSSRLVGNQDPDKIFELIEGLHRIDRAADGEGESQPGDQGTIRR